MDDFIDFDFDFETIASTPPVITENLPQAEKKLYKDISQSSVKAYKCTFSNCGKIFRFKSEITRHSVTHQTERPYSCIYEDCKKTFKRADSLKNHMRTHIGKLSYICEVIGCDKSFATKAGIQYHKLQHVNSCVFNCEFLDCNKSFLTPSQLNQHQKALHPGFSTINVKEEEKPVKLMKIESEQSFDDKIQWEIKSQCNGHDSLGQKRLGVLLAYILNENMVLKEQLQEYQKLAGMLEKNSRDKNCLDYQIDLYSTKELGNFFDNNEMKILEFIKGKEDTSF